MLRSCRYSLSLSLAVDTGQSPSLHCVLLGEGEVVCSWEVSRELDHFITYQLAYRHHQSERYCADSTVTSDLGGAVLRYSCTMAAADPARLVVRLLPQRSAKRFKADKHSEWTREGEVERWRGGEGDAERRRDGEGETGRGRGGEMERWRDWERERWREGEVEREMLRDGEMERERLGEGEVERWRDGKMEREMLRDGEVERWRGRC
ncbi:hypothetical protein EYF80_042965 [Liparis tanakae]|uniref:Fibronectin type-III domain-containing protein n=1 Tax=Liparis tanakae TaxID=230148 RepID=A0A4Z2G125_9TELE|nr:hypothetical protein EYF80_042965 [Liparis tanakae]